MRRGVRHSSGEDGAAMAQYCHIVSVGEGVAQLVRNQDDRTARRSKCPELCEQLGHVHRRKNCRRLVENYAMRIMREGPDYLELLSVGTSEIRNASRGIEHQSGSLSQFVNGP